MPSINRPEHMPDSMAPDDVVTRLEFKVIPPVKSDIAEELRDPEMEAIRDRQPVAPKRTYRVSDKKPTPVEASHEIDPEALEELAKDDNIVIKRA